MTSLTHDQAYDSMAAHFNVHWSAEASAVNDGKTPEVDWPNVDDPEAKLEDGTDPWAKFNVAFQEGDVKGFGERDGRRLFDYAGVVSVQVFVPAGKRGLGPAHTLAKVALDAFKGQRTSEGVRFRRASLRTVGNTGGSWYQVNVEAAFEFDEVA